MLTVEDEAPILLQLGAILEDEKLEVIGTAMSSIDAVRLVTLQPIDLVLIDLISQMGSPEEWWLPQRE